MHLLDSIVICSCGKGNGDIVDPKERLECAAFEKDDVCSNALPKKFLVFSTSIQFPQHRYDVLFSVLSGAGKFKVEIRH